MIPLKNLTIYYETLLVSCLFGWYMPLCFELVPRLSYGISVLIFLAVIFVFSYFSFLLCRKNRTMLNLFSSAILPFGVYDAAIFFIYRKKFYLFVFFFGILLAAVFALVVFLKKEKKPFKIIGIFCMNAFSFLLGIGVLITFSSSVFLGTPFAMPFAGENIFIQKEQAYPNFEKEIDVAANFKNENWAKLSFEKKAELSFEFMKISMIRLGLEPSEAAFEIIFLEEGLWGIYDPNKKTIAVDKTLIQNGNGEDVLETIIHECYHAFQHKAFALWQKLSEEEKKLYCFLEMERIAETGDFEEGAYNFSGREADFYFKLIDIYEKEEGLK